MEFSQAFVRFIVVLLRPNASIALYQRHILSLKPHSNLQTGVPSRIFISPIFLIDETREGTQF